MTQRSRVESIHPLVLGTTLFLLSTATVLFTLATFRLLSFFIMPSLFFDLLFVGFPIGAFIGARFFSTTLRSFRKTLWILQAIMALSVIAALFCKHFDYLRAHLFDVHLGQLLLQMGTFTAFFIPFFCSYGLSEYLGYQEGRRRLAGRMAIVYSLYLFGAAFAYLAVDLALPLIGVSRMLLVSIILIITASLLLSSRGWRRSLLIAELVLLGGVLALPDFVEQQFLTQYKGRGEQSTWEYRKVLEPNYETVFQEWGKYSLTEVLYSEGRDEYAGFYNDLMQWEYSRDHGFTERSLGMVPIGNTPEGGKIAVVGAGGGRQVRWAQKPWFKFREIVALELEPAVFRAVRGTLRERFGEVYEADNVTAIRHEARSYLEQSSEERARFEKTSGDFDLIYLPSVGGYPQMMLEPGNMIRTVNAYETLRDRLTERGVLAIWYPSGLDPKGVLTTQYVRTLVSERVGLRVKTYCTPEEFLILAAKSPQTHLPSCAELDEFFTAPATARQPLPIVTDAHPFPYFVLDDPDYRPITDDQPFLAGNVAHIFSLAQVSKLFCLVAGVLVLLGLCIFFVLRKAGDPHIPGRSYWQVAGLSLLIGANFLVFEHFVILALFKKQYVFPDALVLGAVCFLILSGLGSILIRPRWFSVACGSGIVLFALLVFFQSWLTPLALLGVAAPIAMITGSFFPALFELSHDNPLAVFALDAIGAGLGSMLAFFLPIAFGFSAFFPVAGGIFLLTCCASWLFFRPLTKATSRTTDPGAEDSQGDGSTTESDADEVLAGAGEPREERSTQ